MKKENLKEKIGKIMHSYVIRNIGLNFSLENIRNTGNMWTSDIFYSILDKKSKKGYKNLGLVGFINYFQKEKHTVTTEKYKIIEKVSSLNEKFKDIIYKK